MFSKFRMGLIGTVVILALPLITSSEAAAPPKSAPYVGHSRNIADVDTAFSVCDRAGVGSVCLVPFAAGKQRIVIKDFFVKSVASRYEVVVRPQGLELEHPTPLLAGTFCDSVEFNTDRSDILVSVWILDGSGSDCPEAEPGVTGRVGLLSLSPGVG